MLTHHRPQLFQRALKSVLDQWREDVEIIVNNDSCDIVEVQHPMITYHYYNCEHLSHKYEYLFNLARGEHVYFLEDDDYLTPGFFDAVLPNLHYDVIGGNFYPTYNHTFILKTTQLFRDSKPFVVDREMMQLSQFIIRKCLLDDFIFPDDSHIHNDYKLIMHVLSKTTNILPLSKILYYQTTDGGDNISFPESPNYYGI